MSAGLSDEQVLGPREQRVVACGRIAVFCRAAIAQIRRASIDFDAHQHNDQAGQVKAMSAVGQADMKSAGWENSTIPPPG